MKLFLALLAATAANAHSIFQRVSINGADKGYLVGVRSPSTNNPVQNVNSNDIICNTGLVSPQSSTILDIPAGAKVGTLWQHVLGGAQYSGDVDNPIASSHKGPMMVYLAKVSNAGTSGTTGLSWFKVAQEGFDTSTKKWGVDTVLANAGWWYFTMPACIAPGNYLMRVELLALHSAYNSGGAQFYMSCANINISGSGSQTGSNMVSFPGAYTADNAGILLNIYGKTGLPDNDGKAYTPPGPSVITCTAGSSPTTTTAAAGTTMVTSVRVSTTTTAASGGSCAAQYAQCGGTGWTGATCCTTGTCSKLNDYYSQCLA